MADFVDWKKVYVGRLWAKVKAPFVVPFLSKQERISDETYGVRDAKDLGCWNIAFRNAAHNHGNRPVVPYTQEGAINETVPGTFVRVRHTLDGDFFSYRKVWGKVRPKKGKKEFYYGWVPNSDGKTMRPSIQFRPF
jgi:hypothetical protein